MQSQMFSSATPQFWCKAQSGFEVQLQVELHKYGGSLIPTISRLAVNEPWYVFHILDSRIKQNTLREYHQVRTLDTKDALSSIDCVLQSDSRMPNGSGAKFWFDYS